MELSKEELEIVRQREGTDVCLDCGKEMPAKLWGADCESGHQVVHQQRCEICLRLIGIMIDDDYSSVDILVCPDCLDKIKAKNKENAKR